jgi:hypothetical protein
VRGAWLVAPGSSSNAASLRVGDGVMSEREGEAEAALCGDGVMARCTRRRACEARARRAQAKIGDATREARALVCPFGRATPSRTRLGPLARKRT